MALNRSILLAGLAMLIGWTAWGSPAVAAPPIQGEKVHVVQAGDTLGRIARRYGVPLADLVAANGLADPDRIVIGQRLIIGSRQALQSPTRTHTVRAGETLFRIALQYDLSIEDLVTANLLPDPNYLFIGQQLLVPSAPDALAQLESSGNDYLSAANVDIIPGRAVQGQTVTIHVHPDSLPAGTRIVGTLLDQELRFIPDPSGDGDQWALVGIPALTDPGQYGLSLAAEGYGGTMWTWLTIAAGDFSTDHIQLSPETSRLLDPTLVQAEWAKLNKHWSYVRTDRLWGQAFGFPVASDTRVSSPFGTRRSYNGGPASSYHEGIDFAASGGTSVFAPAGGEVVLAEQLTVRGNTVLIDHGWGVVTGYSHLSHIDVQAGQHVTRGDIIGQVGSTGLSTGDHLHWEVRIRSVPVDPRQWMQQGAPATAGR